MQTRGTDREYSDRELQEAAQRTANVYARIVNKRFGCTIPVPVQLKFDLEFESMEMAKAAGRAHSSMLMDLNMTLFRENVSHILNETIPHEMGHLVQFNKFDLKGLKTLGHGVYWKEAMRAMGKVPHQHHTLDVSSAVASYKEHKRKQKEAAKARKANRDAD